MRLPSVLGASLAFGYLACALVVDVMMIREPTYSYFKALGLMVASAPLGIPVFVFLNGAGWSVPRVLGIAVFVQMIQAAALCFVGRCSGRSWFSPAGSSPDGPVPEEWRAPEAEEVARFLGVGSGVPKVPTPVPRRLQKRVAAQVCLCCALTNVAALTIPWSASRAAGGGLIFLAVVGLSSFGAMIAAVTSLVRGENAAGLLALCALLGLPLAVTFARLLGGLLYMATYGVPTI